MNTLTIEQALALAKILNENSGQPNKLDLNAIENGDGRTVIVRSRDAGVLVGNYHGREGSNIHLKNAVQMWQWKAAKGGTLIDCATFGAAKSGNKFSNSSATLTVFNACTLIDCTDEAVKSLRSIEASTWA